MNRLPELLSNSVTTFSLPTTIIMVALGVVSLVAGKKYYWVATGLNSFLAAYIAVSTVMNWPAWQDLLTSVVAGVVVALLTVALRHISLALNAFFIFGLLVAVLLTLVLPFESNSFTPVVIFFVAGSAAAFYNLMKPTAAIIPITAFVGGFAVSCGVFGLLHQSPSPIYLIVMWLVLGIAGTVWQTLHAEKKKMENN